MEAGDLSEEWSDRSSSSESDPDADDNNTIMTHTHDSQPPSHKAKFHPLFYQFFGFLILWQAAFNISNAAISAFMKLFKYFILLLGRAFNCNSLSTSANHLPINRELIVQLFNSCEKVYTEYVVCPKCDSLYKLKDCIKYDSSGTAESKTCCRGYT